MKRHGRNRCSEGHPADIPGLVQCAAGLFAEDSGTRDKTIDAEWPAKQAAQRFSETISDPARLVLAARHAADVIGSLSGVLEATTAMRLIRVATLTSIYVYLPYRRSGVGARLWNKFRAWAQEMNATRIAVTGHTPRTLQPSASTGALHSCHTPLRWRRALRRAGYR